MAHANWFSIGNSFTIFVSNCNYLSWIMNKSRVMHKKGHKLKTSPSVKNPQFSSNLADIQAELLTFEIVTAVFF